jgi:hypothetical protein
MLGNGWQIGSATAHDATGQPRQGVQMSGQIPLWLGQIQLLEGGTNRPISPNIVTQGRFLRRVWIEASANTVNQKVSSSEPLDRN